MEIGKRTIRRMDAENQFKTKERKALWNLNNIKDPASTPEIHCRESIYRKYIWGGLWGRHPTIKFTKS
jgi:hypothetical protein